MSIEALKTELAELKANQKAWNANSNGMMEPCAWMLQMEIEILEAQIDGMPDWFPAKLAEIALETTKLGAGCIQFNCNCKTIQVLEGTLSQAWKLYKCECDPSIKTITVGDSDENY